MRCENSLFVTDDEGNDRTDAAASGEMSESLVGRNAEHQNGIECRNYSPCIGWGRDGSGGSRGGACGSGWSACPRLVSAF